MHPLAALNSAIPGLLPVHYRPCESTMVTVSGVDLGVPGMSRKGALWRGELAQRVAECLAGALPAADLLEWALDHPFFEDREQLSEDEQRIIAQALGTVLRLAPDEPFRTRTTLEQLAALVEVLWPGFQAGGGLRGEEPR
jgi:hypothetical protein